MAFQVSAYEIEEFLNLFVKLREAKVNVVDYLGQVADEKKYVKMNATLQAIVALHKNGKDPLNLRRILCWKNPEGKPGELVFEYKGSPS